MNAAAVMAFFGVFAAVIGLVLGSFCNVAIGRMPEGRSVVTPGSHCEACGNAVRWYDNIPVWSYLRLGGACRGCGARIPATFPLIEALVGLLALALYRRIFADPLDFDLAHGAAFAYFLGFICLLVIASYIDLKHWIVPDETSIYAVPAGILGAVVLQALQYDGAAALTWRQAVAGATFGGGLFATVAIGAYAIMGREGLGWGDVKLMAMIGAFLGASVWVSLFLGTLLGAVVGLLHLAITRRRSYLPLGPILAVAAVVTLFYGDPIIRVFFPGIALMQGL